MLDAIEREQPALPSWDWSATASAYGVSSSPVAPTISTGGAPVGFLTGPRYASAASASSRLRASSVTNNGPKCGEAPTASLVKRA